MPARRALIMHPSDNVATAVEEIQPGDEVVATVGQQTVTLQALERIRFGFKIAVADIPGDEILRKYGDAIGRAGVPIARGALVHVHNLEGIRARGDLAERSRP